MLHQRHVPIRTCVACGRKSPKSCLMRIVRLENGTVAIDDEGRMNGRGCYLCFSDEKIDLSKLKSKIKRALKLESDVTNEFLQQLAGRLTSQ